MDQDLLRILGYNLVAVVQDDSRRIGIRTVHNQLNDAFSTGLQVFFKALVQAYQGLNPAVVDQFPDLVFTADPGLDIKIAGTDEPSDHLPAGHAVIQIIDAGGHVLDIGGHGVPEYNHLEDGHDKDDSPGPRVPEDLDEFLDQDLFEPSEHDQTSHFLNFLLARTNMANPKTAKKVPSTHKTLGPTPFR